MRRSASSGLLLALIVGCGGDSPPPPARPGTPAATQPADVGDEPAAPAARPAGAQAQKPKAQVAVDTTTPPQDSTQLVREIFSYRGAGRDPFFSLMKSADVRPLISDVRLMGIVYDATYPARSVAVLRDTAQKKRYSVRIGDELGRMKVTEIRPDQIVVTLDEFGAERQVVLQVRRRPEETP